MFKTCCVTGHRIIPTEIVESIQTALRQEVLRSVEDGFDHFISGFASGVDLMFAEIVTELKGSFPVTLEAAIPYPERMRTPDALFQRLIQHCDLVKTHSEQYYRGSFMRRNQYMVNVSQRMIAVYDGRKTGGTAATVRYARKKGLQIRIIGIGNCIAD